MRASRRLAVLAVVLTQLGCDANDDTTSPVQPVTLAGQVRLVAPLIDINARFLGHRVIDDASGVAVQLMTRGGVGATTTTVGGRYVFSGLLPGSYYLRTVLLGVVLDSTRQLSPKGGHVEVGDTLVVTALGDLRPAPNPRDPSTTIFYSLDDSLEVDIRLRALDGTPVLTLFHAGRPAGLNQIFWAGLDSTGAELGSSVHWVTLESAGPLRAQLLLREHTTRAETTKRPAASFREAPESE